MDALYTIENPQGCVHLLAQRQNDVPGKQLATWERIADAIADPGWALERAAELGFC
jgi:hypothetical protein